MSILLGVPDHALTQWIDLGEALAATPEPPPCAGPDRDHWTGTATQQRTAADRCLDCPAMQACATYALTAGERTGTWGGLTPSARTPKPTRKATTKKKHTRKKPTPKTRKAATR